MREKMLVGVVGTLFLLLPMTAGAQQAGVRVAIERVNKTFADAAKKKDAAAMAGCYTTDGEALPPNGDVVSGRAEIQKMWQGVLDSGISDVAVNTREVESSGNLAWESGTYELKATDGSTADRGKYVVVWKRVGGQWLIHRDIWNSSMPMAGK